jgi:hypothetical protein
MDPSTATVLGAILTAIISGLFLWSIELWKGRKESQKERASQPPKLLLPEGFAPKPRRDRRRYLLIVPAALVGGIITYLIATGLPTADDALDYGTAPSPSAPHASETPPAPEATASATATATLTRTATASPTPTPIEPSSACILAGDEYWQASWLPGGGVSPPQSRNPQDIACFKVEDQGFLPTTPSSDSFGLAILCGSPNNPCITEGGIRGIYANLPSGAYTFHVQLNSIAILKEGPLSDDVDLILGVGDPLLGSGRFLVFRLVNPTGKVHICAPTTYPAYCDPISAGAIESLPPLTVTINLNQDLDIHLDGVPVAHWDQPPPQLRILWIGYSFKSLGMLDATISFPSTLRSLLIREH